jgi:hypothetical protein
MTHTEMHPPEADKDFHIVVNGQPKTLEDDDVTYDGAIVLAWGSIEPNYRYTVTYRNAAAPKRDGIMRPGDTVEVKNGTIFDVHRTYKS